MPESADPDLEATRMMSLRRFSPIARRPATVHTLLIDEVSMMESDRLEVMVELLRQSRHPSSPACLVYALGDFLELGPLFGELSFTAKCWSILFGNSMLELTRVHRQHQPDFVSAVRDARIRAL